MEFRNIGPFRGGRVDAVTGVRGQPLVFYFGGTGGGVWKTVDGGSNWRPISDKDFQTGSVGAIAVAESDPNVDLRGDGGGGDPRQRLQRRRRLQVDRRRQDLGQRRPEETRTRSRACASTRRTRTSSTSRRRATSGARTPSAASSGRRTAARPGRRCCSSPTRPAPRTSAWIRPTRGSSTPASGRCTASPGRSRPAAPEGGVYRSTDGGDTWKKLAGGLPEGVVGNIGVAVSGARPERVWAIVEAEKGGVYPLRRRRREVDARQLGEQAPPARLVLHADLRRPEERRRGLRAERRASSDSNDGGKTFAADPRAARRQPRPVDRPGRPAADDRRQRRRRERVVQRRAAPGRRS